MLQYLVTLATRYGMIVKRVQICFTYQKAVTKLNFKTLIRGGVKNDAPTSVT